MTDSRKAQRKKILSDPVAMLGALYPDAAGQQISEITALSREYVELEKKLKKVRNEANVISRQIGQAKRDGSPIDDLKQCMREHSKRLADINDKLGETGERIMGIFEREECSHNSRPPKSAVPEGRVYADPSESGCEVSVSLLGSDTEDWNLYVARNPACSCYHRSEWRTLIQGTFGHQGYYFYARDTDGHIVGILPLIRLRSRLFGDFMASMPYFNYGGAIADHSEIEQKLMDAANEHAAELGVSHIEYRDDMERIGYRTRTDKVNMILPLPDSYDDLWNKFPSKLRAQIRRPQRENVRILSGGAQYLDDFYAVFSRNMRDLGTPVYGKSFFRNILSDFGAESRILVVRLDDRPVAAGFLISHKGILEIPWASTIREANRLSVNMLLYWEALKFAIENSYSYFDFGRSSRESGTFHFKRQWGAKPKQLHWHYWLNGNNPLPALNPHNPKYALAINIWKRLPLFTTNWLGPMIVKNLP